MSMKTGRYLKYILYSTIGVLSLSSCMSTEIIEPEKIPAVNDRIVLGLSTPDEIQTRATDGYKLRYIAKIFTGETQGALPNTPLASKEIIDGEVENNQIEFVVDPNAYYTILIFADYIPASYQPETDGRYKDYFYDTKSYTKSVVTKVSPGTKEDKIAPEFFNNDYYDCFQDIVVLYKEEEEYRVTKKLKRATSLIKFQDISGNSGDYTLKIKSIKIKPNLSIDTQLTPDAVNKNVGSITFSQSADDTNKEDAILYFYSLVDDKTDKQNVSIEFIVNKEGSEEKSVTVNDIPIKRNYKTIVKGKFIPDKMETPPEIEEPKEKGNIILNLSVDNGSDSWEQEELTKEY